MILTQRHLLRSFSLLLLALAATSAYAAENYLKVIPSTALAWGAVNHMNEASGKIQKLATIVQAPAVSVLDQLKTVSGVTKGLDEKGPAGFFGVPGKTEKDASVGATFVAVANEKEFLGNFEVVKAGEKISEVKLKTSNTTTHCLAMRNGYALLSPKSDRAALEAAVEAKQDISAEMAGLESWLAENDAVVVGTAAGIKYAAKQASEGLAKSKDEIANAPEAAALRPILDLYGKALTAMPSQFSLAVAGIRCDKEGSIRIVGRARLVNGGLISNAIAGIPPVKENLLSGVPGGPFVFAGGGVSISKLFEGYMDLAIGFIKSMKSVYGMSAEDLERMSKESIEVFRQVRSMSFVMKTGKRGDPIYSNMFSAMRVDDSQRFLELFEKSAENTSKLMQNAKQGMLKSMTVKRLEIAGKRALQQEMNFDLSRLGVPEVSRAMVDEMMGVGGKMLVYYVTADEHTVLMGIGVSQERMVAALDVVKQPKKSLAEDADVSVTAAMLPADAQWVAYMSPRGYMQLTQRLMTAMMKNMPGMAAEAFSLPQFPKCPPVGFAVKAAPDELHGEIAVPAPMLQAAGEFVKDMQKMIMDRAMQQNQPPAP
ncbi:MAG: hypothetical protein ABSG53_04620 [Thermoguttaceae bacterium]